MKKFVFVPLLVLTITSCGTQVVREYNIIDKVKLVSNNASDYQLVIPNSQNEYINMAVNEFSSMMEKATGATFNVVDVRSSTSGATLPIIIRIRCGF